MIFSRKRVTQLERRCEFLEDDVKVLEAHVRELQGLMSDLLGDGVEIRSEVQFVPADHVLEQKH